MNENPIVFTLKREDLNKASLPMDLIVGDVSDRPPEFFITQIENTSPEIVTEEEVGEGRIKITIKSERCLKKAFDKFNEARANSKKHNL